MTPSAFTTGADRQELEKRLAADLVEASPALFLDNANGFALRSDTLASVMTERPARVRLLGQTQMVLLNSTAFIAVTGNGLSVSEDLARRFIPCSLDARCEDPETRPFASGFLGRIEQRRPELLAAALTIWRWARQNAGSIAKGKPLGSFEDLVRVVPRPAAGPWMLRSGRAHRSTQSSRSTPPAYRRPVQCLVGTSPEHPSENQRPCRSGRRHSAMLKDAAGSTLRARSRATSGPRWPGSCSLVWKPPSGLQRPTCSNRLSRAGIEHRGHRGHRVEAQQREPLVVPMTPMTPMTPMPYGGPADDENASWQGGEAMSSAAAVLRDLATIGAIVQPAGDSTHPACWPASHSWTSGPPGPGSQG